MRHVGVAIALSTLLLVSICSAQQPGHKASPARTGYTETLSDSALFQPGETSPAIREARRSHRLPANGWPARNMPMPSSPDNWNGGTGNWSNPANWSAGLPGGNSDVVIHSGGDDNVLLSTSASINSLTLGGTGGNSTLEASGTAQSLVIAGALTIRPPTGVADLYISNGYSCLSACFLWLVPALAEQQGLLAVPVAKRRST